MRGTTERSPTTLEAKALIDNSPRRAKRRLDGKVLFREW